MKKTLAMLLAIMMLCALMAGCGQSNQPAASSAASEAAAENNGASEEATSFKVGFIVSDAAFVPSVAGLIIAGEIVKDLSGIQ